MDKYLAGVQCSSYLLFATNHDMTDCSWCHTGTCRLLWTVEVSCSSRSSQLDIWKGFFFAYSSQTNAPVFHYWYFMDIWMIKRAILCIFVHMYICLCIWAFFCRLAVSWNGLGLFLSGLIRGSRLHPSLITLLRANIPFIFSLFHSSSAFVVSGLGRGSATFFSFFLSFIIFYFFYFSCIQATIIFL